MRNGIRSKTVAIVGATGAVGQEIIALLERRDFPVERLRAFASRRSAGRTIRFRDEGLPLEVLPEDGGPEGVDLAFFSAGSSVSRIYVPRFVERGSVVIDNSSAFRLDAEVPLVVPEVNPEAVERHRGILANPNCSTIQMVVALAPIHRAARVRRVVVATYQAVSGAGSRAMEELRAQQAAHARGEKGPRAVFPHPIFDNVIPAVDRFLEDGYTAEEMKMVHETRKILGDPGIQVSATCVRVPVIRAHAEAVHLETERDLDIGDARRLLAEAPGVRVVDDPANHGYPTPIAATGTFEVHVGRIRRDLVFEPGLAFWVVADQLLKGAAWNAVQIAEMLTRNRALG